MGRDQRLRHVKVIPPSVIGAAEAIVEAVADIESLDRAAREMHLDVLSFLSWERAAQLHLRGVFVSCCRHTVGIFRDPCAGNPKSFERPLVIDSLVSM